MIAQASVSPKRVVTGFSPAESERLWNLVNVAARRPDLKKAVEDNHDNNLWWPLSVTDWRVRMAVAGWSARVSYSMVHVYTRVVGQTGRIGFDGMTGLSDEDLLELVGPIGLHHARLSYFRSLVDFLDTADGDQRVLLDGGTRTAITGFARNVSYASYKIAQCAVLYARGYHCGIIPVDSGMITKLAPCLGWQFSRGSIAHEQMRLLLEACVADKAAEYRSLAAELDYRVSIPSDVEPTWWVHLVLIYFKRLYCNRPADRLCVKRPVCARVLDCDCALWDE